MNLDRGEFKDFEATLGDGELEKLKERLTELREISEKKYMFVEKKYRKYRKKKSLNRNLLLRCIRILPRFKRTIPI